MRTRGAVCLQYRKVLRIAKSCWTLGVSVLLKGRIFVDIEGI